MRSSLSDWAVFTDSTSAKFVGDQGRVTMSKTLATKIAQDYMEAGRPCCTSPGPARGGGQKVCGAAHRAAAAGVALCRRAASVWAHDVQSRRMSVLITILTVRQRILLLPRSVRRRPWPLNARARAELSTAPQVLGHARHVIEPSTKLPSGNSKTRRWPSPAQRSRTRKAAAQHDARHAVAQHVHGRGHYHEVRAE